VALVQAAEPNWLVAVQVQAAELKSLLLLVILVQVTAESVETSVQAVALKPLLPALSLYALQFWMA
jgi:hypothetical protein